MAKKELPDILKPTAPGHWRLIVDFSPKQTVEIQAEAERLGINFQAVVKTLIDEALRARQPDAVARRLAKS